MASAVAAVVVGDGIQVVDALLALGGAAHTGRQIEPFEREVDQRLDLLAVKAAAT